MTFFDSKSNSLRICTLKFSCESTVFEISVHKYNFNLVKKIFKETISFEHKNQQPLILNI